MDLRFTPEEQEFRQEVRSFIAANLDKETHASMVAGHRPSKEQIVAWQRILNKKGWATVDWPAEFGGTGWSIIKRHIFREEVQAHPAPEPLAFGVYMVGPVIITFGTQEQKKKFLPRIANLDDWWCQGFSEPGSGSDLASLKTAARRDGDHYIVNGQKTWTTYAQYANWIFCLVRTDPQAGKPQEGISFLLIDMKSPGVTLRPIVTVDGGREINEVFLDDVKVPVENLVGVENRGWDCAKFLLSNERVNTARIGATKERLRR
ncbi:MAG: acyl-CoA dehydrogenase family protein, partial [Beijerinckiaceae bacterium]